MNRALMSTRPDKKSIGHTADAPSSLDRRPRRDETSGGALIATFPSGLLQTRLTRSTCVFSELQSTKYIERAVRQNRPIGGRAPPSLSCPALLSVRVAHVNDRRDTSSCPIGIMIMSRCPLAAPLSFPFACLFLLYSF